MEEEEEKEGEERASGFNDIRMIFDDDEEEEDGEGNSSKNSDEVTDELNKPEDPRSEKNPNVERYAWSVSYKAHKSIAI